MTSQTKKKDARVYVEEIKHRILERFPDAEFDVYKVGPKDYRIHVFGSFGDLFDVLDVTSERVMDILDDHDVYIQVLPLGKRSEN